MSFSGEVKVPTYAISGLPESFIARESACGEEDPQPATVIKAAIAALMQMELRQEMVRFM
jgi:hypothetical protein